MTSNFVIIPLLIPFVVGVVLIFFKANIKLQRIISVLSLITTTAFAAYLVQLVQSKGVLTHELGNWKPPFGIILVADMFASLLVLTASIVTLCCILFAFHTIGVNLVSSIRTWNLYRYIKGDYILHESINECNMR